MKKTVVTLWFLSLMFLVSCNLWQEQKQIENLSNQNTNNLVNDSLKNIEQENNLINWNTEEKKETEIISPKVSWTSSNKGVYTNYSPELLRDDKVNILNFSASWCPNCQSLKKNILSSDIPENLNILEVDFDNSQELKEKYSVTAQTTLVLVDWKWNEIKKWRLSKNLEDILNEIDNTSILPTNNIIKNTTDIQVMPWKYIKYSEDDLKNATWNIVLFFHANWCPACVSIDKNISSNTIPSDLTLLKVDYDNSDDLKTKYGVLSQTTFVQVDNEWNMIKKWVSARDLDDIISKIQ